MQDGTPNPTHAAAPGGGTRAGRHRGLCPPSCFGELGSQGAAPQSCLRDRGAGTRFPRPKRRYERDTSFQTSLPASRNVQRAVRQRVGDSSSAAGGAAMRVPERVIRGQGREDGARGAEAGPGRPRPRGFRVGEGSCGPPQAETQLPRGSRGSRRASPWSPGPGRDDAKRPLGCASQLDTRVVVTRSVPGAGRHDLREREWASPWRHFPPTRVLRKPSAGRPQSET